MSDDYDCIKTQNGWACPSMDLIDDTIDDKVIYGGGGNQGLNRLGQPYPTSNIGSGPRVETGPDDVGIRKGASFSRNFERTRNMTDRRYDQEERYTTRR